MSQQCSEAQVLKELERLLASREFAGANRAARFLKYAVERSLADDRQSLKEAVIGTEVFDRAPGYDPKAEPIVRTEARRLRSKLEDFYRQHTDSSLRISIPKGSYVAVFEETGAATEERPVLLSDRRPHWRQAWGLVAVCILITGGVSATLMRLSGPGAGLSLPVLTTVTSFPGGQNFPSLSPDGTRVAFIWRGEDEQAGNVYVSKVDGGSPVRVTTDTAGGVFPVFSPDGKRIAYIRQDRGLMIAGPDGGNERFLAKAFTSMLAWSPDGKQLAYCSLTEDGTRFAIFSADPETGAHRQITYPPSASAWDYYADFSPDGRQLAFARCLVGGCRLFTMPSEGGPPKEIAAGEVQGVTWSPDGKTLVFSSKRLGQYQLWRIPAKGPDKPQPIGFAGEGARFPRFGRNPSGPTRLVYEQHVDDTNIWRTRLDTGAAGRQPQRIIASTRLDSSPQVSPGNDRIAFVSDRSGFPEIWVSDAGGANPAEITRLRLETGSPRWSPDGRQIAFDVVSKDGRAIFLADASGGNPRQLTEWRKAGRPSWSRDGRWVYFGDLDSKGEHQVFRVAAGDGAQRMQMTQDGGFEAFESADGKMLLYLHERELRRMPAEGGRFSVVTDRPIRMGSWSVTAKGIYFVDLSTARYTGSMARGEKVVYLLDPSTGAVRRVSSIAGDFNTSLPDFCASPDGQALYYSVLELSVSQIRMMEGGF